MKKSHSLLMLPLVAACLLFPSSLFSQEAKRLFVDMPDSLCQLLTKVNREDCIDFLESKMKAVVENRFRQNSEMTSLGRDYISMQMSAQSTWQMKVLAMNDSVRVIAVVSTVCAPACDSSLKFYTTEWKPLDAGAFVSLPSMDDFLTAPDSADIYEYDEARRAADMLLMKADFSKDNSDLTFTLTTPDYMAAEMAEKLAPYVRPSLVYKWESGRFVKKER